MIRRPDANRRRAIAESERWKEELLESQERRYTPHIIFGAVDESGSFPRSNRALEITAVIAGSDVSRILIDTGSSVDIIYANHLRQLTRGYDIQQVETEVVGFTGDVLRSRGQVMLPLSLGDYPMTTNGTVKFLIMDVTSPYNIILWRPSMNMFQAVVSTFHAKIKFPVGEMVGEVQGDKPGRRESLYFRHHVHHIDLINAGTPKGPKYDTIGGGEEIRPIVDPEGKEQQHIIPTEGLRDVGIDPECEEHVARIGMELQEKSAQALISFLTVNRDVFAWKPSDLAGVSPTVATHFLNLCPDAKLVKQKRRHFGVEKDRIIEGEVQTLLEAGHIRRIQYPTWLSNAVLARKGGDRWRMCIDFRDLNKACPKDHYPLPRIDQLVDATAGCGILSKMDASQGYHQIALVVDDQPNVSFIMASGTYCYVVMPFGLKNAGVTYQRLVDNMFRDQSDRNMEVYVDDMLVKSPNTTSHIRDFEETFATLRKYGMKPSQVRVRGQVKAILDQVKAILDMSPPRMIKDVQTLMGRIAALSRFLSTAAETSYPFFRSLRKGKNFEWTEECDTSFRHLKQVLTGLQLLTKPHPGEKLYIYLSVGEKAVSSVLVNEKSGCQQPINYASKLLRGGEVGYSQMEKAGLALMSAARKVRPYFISHLVVIRTNFPLKTTLGKLDVSGRMMKWAVDWDSLRLATSPVPRSRDKHLWISYRKPLERSEIKEPGKYS